MTQIVTKAGETAGELAPVRTRSANLNIPNSLTVVRLLMIPAILWTFEARIGDQLVAPLLFVAASITDSLDGRIARRYGKVTTLGKFLDPLADKMLILAVLAVLVQDGLLPAWVVVLILGRELLITGLRAIGGTQGLIIAATPFGKTKTVSQMAAVGLVMLERPYPQLEPLAFAVVALAVIFTMFSGLDYVWRYRRLLYR
ncbi:MAG TPA: CDP-diacylglycerol--glycerol-3-phosphate 3-phosphatidyltransferase [Candidatus Dormibacteraeota bacterium]|jgi:CDP-diacylglycerol--glycerol-3-phosphate 3-phosphatidyltransferase|nr:CDP-diacylglycerol--glycerol-3-phosphate 3-phosphatidyltransferase [Candidatus Dormibacteraeota bacterium]